MELSALTIYLIDVSETLKTFFFMAALSASAVTLGFCPCLIDVTEESRERLLRNLKRGVCTAAFCALGAVLTPSSKTLVAMYVLPAIVNNERVQNISVDLMKLAEKWVREQLGEKETK